MIIQQLMIANIKKCIARVIFYFVAVSIMLQFGSEITSLARKFNFTPNFRPASIILSGRGVQFLACHANMDPTSITRSTPADKNCTIKVKYESFLWHLHILLAFHAQSIAGHVNYLDICFDCLTSPAATCYVSRY